MVDQDQAFRQCCEADRLRMAPPPPALPPIEPSVQDGMILRLRLRSGQTEQRRFSLEATVRSSVLEFAHYCHQDRQMLRLGVRDGMRMRWLELDRSLPEQGVLPMDLVVCRDE